MAQEVQVIPLALPLKTGTVNCYLLPAGSGFVLIDSGVSSQRAGLLAALQAAGCSPGKLRLVFLTHGDFDHTGSAAYLQQEYGAKVALHPAERAAVERGNMFAGRSSGGALLNALAALMFGFGQRERFTPDLAFSGGESLAAYGLEAQVMALPGHSRGSLGLLTGAGDLFCGDLLENLKQPALNDLMDDRPAGQASLERLRTLGVRQVYPGHGRPFSLEAVSLAASRAEMS